MAALAGQADEWRPALLRCVPEQHSSQQAAALTAAEHTENPDRGQHTQG